MHLRLSTAFLLILIVTDVAAQQKVSGKIYERITDSLLPGVNVFNSRTKMSVRSGPDGRYALDAMEEDKIIFSMAGFVSDTLTVSFDKLLTEHNVTLAVQYISLKGVTVTGGYAVDSLNRRNEYRHIYEGQKGITGGNRPTNGFGISISPVSFFSSKAKQARKLKKRLIEDEHEAYIDFMFSKEWIKQISKLNDDSLRLFAYRYRPTYKFCRSTDRAGMLIYINDKLKEFRKPGA
jgi:hypothetical protein